MANKQLFEYTVILQEKVDKDDVVVEEAQVVVPVAPVLAADEGQATLLASRAIPDEHIAKLDRLTVVVRPF